MIDDRLSFSSHIDHAYERAVQLILALSRIMPNNAAISSSKKRLLGSVFTSVPRYARSAWHCKTKGNPSRLDSTFRLMAMRASGAYRIISPDAAYAIAGTMPINLLLEEDIKESVNETKLIP
ncbi:uncharacterized protein LOC131679833 [Topomyia yanbarensis]|uniref:uncharacterized protein LOC131679833 n=1 Tax=Topomyia yanbarensis TaxID=2498891 RepID=UPI00273CC93F|nr:uncharacterized protein LOC131679833 [Topomyia yanbarensis]